MKAVTFFMNAYTWGKSGGDVACIQIMKKIKPNKLTVVTSWQGKKLCASSKITGSFIITSHEKDIHNILLTYAKRIFNAIAKQKQYDTSEVIYSSSDQLPDILPAYIYKWQNMSQKWIVKIYHEIPKQRLIPHILQRAQWRIIKHLSDHIIVPSNKLAQLLTVHGFPPQKISVVALGITPVRLTSKPKYIYDAVYVGRLHASKGIYDIIDIWKHVAMLKPNARMAIIGIGDTQTTKKIKQTIKEKYLDDAINLYGYLSDSQARKIIQNAACFILPSYEEGFSISIGEALAHNTLVIAYNLATLQEIYDGAIVTIPRRDIKLFAEKIIDVISYPQKYQKYKQRGKKYIKKYTWDKTSQMELDIINKSIS